MRTGLSPRSTWTLGKASRASRVCADMRTRMACFGFEWIASPGLDAGRRGICWFVGRGMMVEGRREWLKCTILIYAYYCKCSCI